MTTLLKKQLEFEYPHGFALIGIDGKGEQVAVAFNPHNAGILPKIAETGHLLLMGAQFAILQAQAAQQAMGDQKVASAKKIIDINSLRNGGGN